MRDDVGLPDVLFALRRLCAGLGRPFASKIESMAEEYLGSLRRHGIPRVALDPAVSAALDRESGRFPSPGQLVMLAKPFIPRTDHERQTEASPGSCPNCRTPLYFAGFRFPNGVVLPRLRCQCKPPEYAREAWDHPDAKAWRDGSEWSAQASMAALKASVGKPLPTEDLRAKQAALREGFRSLAKPALVEVGDAYEGDL